MSVELRLLYCPRCQFKPLERGHFAEHELDACPRCGGLWCRPNEWDRDQLGRPPGKGRGEELVPLSLVESPQDDPFHVGLKPTAGIACPECETPLTGLVLGGENGCELDQCPRCGGVWFDNGEWDHVAALHNWETHLAAAEKPTTWGHWAFQLFSGLPVEFNVRPHRTPVVTYLLIAVCVGVFIGELMVGPDELVESFGMRPSRILDGSGLITLLTSMFLHAGWIHLLGNMYFLWVLGDNVEDVMGRLGFLLFYLVCGLAADVLGVFIDPTSELTTIGASGAIAGVMAAYVVLFHQARLTFMLIFFQFKVSALVWIGIWLGIQVFGVWLDPTGGGSGVAWLAHLGGFAAGLLIVMPLRGWLVRRSALLRVIHGIPATNR